MSAGPGQRPVLASAAPGRGMLGGGPSEPAVRTAYATAAALFVAYAVWGSLFPFDFHPVPLADAAALFWTRWASDTGPWSLTDLLSNVLLFLPIGLLLSAAFGRTAVGLAEAGRADHPGPAKAGHYEAPGPAEAGHYEAAGPAEAGHYEAKRTALVTMACAATLSVIVEFAQAFVSWRTPSIVDVAAEVAGAACGVVVWRLVSAEFDRVLSALVAMIRRSGLFERVLLASCAAFAIAWLLPADFTLRPAEIGDKYAHKRLLLPGTPSPDAAGSRDLALVAVAAVPVGLAAVLCGCGDGSRRSLATGALAAAMLLVGLELVQIPVFSRTTDANELLAALGGSTAGAAAAALIDRGRVIGVNVRMIQATAAVLLWTGAVLALEWWPFQLAADPTRMQFETTLWSRAPFRWPATAADVVPGAVLAAIAGVVAYRRLDPRFRRLQTMVVVGFAAAVFAACEGGRVVLAGGRPTLLSVMFKLAALGGGLYAGSVLGSRRWTGEAS